MSARQRNWAARTWAHLIADLGGRCARCGKKRDLELDCIRPQGHKHHRIEWSWRISFYRSQYAAGNLQVLCKHCNAKKGASYG